MVSIIIGLLNKCNKKNQAHLSGLNLWPLSNVSCASEAFMVHTEHIKFGLPQAADLNIFYFKKINTFGPLRGKYFLWKNFRELEKVREGENAQHPAR